MILMILIGFLAGIISGMGIGGGTILIPALVLLFKYDQRTAQNINLIYFIPTAVIAIVTHLKNDAIEKSVLWKLILYGFAGAALGSFLAITLDSQVLRKIFAGFLLLMGLMEIFRKSK